MEIINVKLADLALSPDNVRMHPRRQIEEYKRSLSMFGQTKNAVIDEDSRVLIGNGLVMAARELGWEEIYAIRRTGLPENDKLKLMVSDNKIWSLGVDNLDVLDVIFQKLQDDLDIPGYDEDTLKNMIGEAEAVTDEIAGYGRLSDEEIQSISNRPEATIKNPTTLEAIQATVAQAPQSQTMATDSHNVPDNENDGKILVECPKCGEEIWLSKDVLRPLM